VVSLIASATEIVCALGLEDRLVGRSHECDFPPSVARLPACSETRIDVATSSRKIDRQVKEVLADALSVYRVDAEMLARLQPTVILTQTQCEVCAVSLKDVERAVCEWIGTRPRIVALEPMDLADVWTDIRRVADALGVSQRGETLVASLRRRLEHVQEKIADVSHRPTAACIEWIDPLMAAGNWVPELVEIAGGTNLFGEAGRHSPWMTWEQVVERDPEVLVIMPCGFDIPRTRAEMPSLLRQPGWQSLSAVRGDRVFLADGNQYFNRPGPRLAESAEILAELLHPDRCRFDHENAGWEGWTVR
ncbi:MAG: cobalamin-binding protein, partial [Planctomycetaceae bacterium]